MFQDESGDSDVTRDPTSAAARSAEVPVTLAMDAILLSTDRAVVYLTGAAVYSSGLSFEIRAVVAGGGPARPVAGASGRSTIAQHERQLMLGVEYPDGRSAHNFGSGRGRAYRRTADEVRLSANSGDYYGDRATLTCFLSPLPPEGDLIFAVAWPARGLVEHVTAVAVGDVTGAVRRVTSIVLTPAPPVPPTTPLPVTMPVGGWFDEHLGLTDQGG